MNQLIGRDDGFSIPVPVRVDVDTLRGALVDMVARYGDAVHRAGITVYAPNFGGKSHEYWELAAQRRFAAVQRLSAALRDLKAADLGMGERDLKPGVERPHDTFPVGCGRRVRAPR